MSPHGPKPLRSKGGSKNSKGLSLERFAAAKSSGYNKREKKEKQFALNANKINKYRKLKHKLQQRGVLPQEDQQEAARLSRIQQRAGSPLAESSDDEARRDAAAEQQPQSPNAPLQSDTGAASAVAIQQQPNAAAGQAEPATNLLKVQAQSGPVSQTKTKTHKRHKPESHLQRLSNKVQADKAVALQQKEEALQAAAEHEARVAAVEKHRKQQTSLLRKKTKKGQPVMKHRIDKILDFLQQ